MIVATNTENLEPLAATRPSITTGWKDTLYAGEDYFTDGTSLVPTGLLAATERRRLTARFTKSWPARRPLPTQDKVAAIVRLALAAPQTPVELLGVAGGQAFLRRAPNHDTCAPAARLAYLVKLTGADRITATPWRTRGPNTYVLWAGDVFAGLLAIA